MLDFAKKKSKVFNFGKQVIKKNDIINYNLKNSEIGNKVSDSHMKYVFNNNQVSAQKDSYLTENQKYNSHFSVNI